MNLLCYKLSIDSYTGGISLVGINTQYKGALPVQTRLGQGQRGAGIDSAEAHQRKRTLQDFP